MKREHETKWFLWIFHPLTTYIHSPAEQRYNGACCPIEPSEGNITLTLLPQGSRKVRWIRRSKGEK